MADIKEIVKDELDKIKAPYAHFVKSAISEAETFQSENPHIWEQLLAFLTRHENLSASDVCDYMGYAIGIPYRADDGKWYRWDDEITEEEARKIVQEKYSG